MKNLIIILVFFLYSCKEKSFCYLVETETVTIFKKDVVNPGTYPDYATVKRTSETLCNLNKNQEDSLLSTKVIQEYSDAEKCITIHTIITKK